MRAKNIIFIAAIVSSISCYAKAADETFFFKGNMGRGIAKQKAIGTVNSVQNYTIKKTGKGFIGGVTIGARINSNIRVGWEVLADNGLKTNRKMSSGMQLSVMKTSSYVTFADFYYDFKNSTYVTPFITLGAGYGFNKYKISVLPLNSSLVARKFTKSSNGIAYQGGLGLAYNIGKADLEVEYRYISKGGRNKLMTLSSTNFMKAKSGSSNIGAVMAGLRVGF